MNKLSKAKEPTVDRAERSDEEIIRDGIQLVGPAWNREMSAIIRESMRQADPATYATLVAKHPLLFGKDSLRRIELEFPELFLDPPVEGMRTTTLKPKEDS